MPSVAMLRSVAMSEPVKSRRRVPWSLLVLAGVVGCVAVLFVMMKSRAREEREAVEARLEEIRLSGQPVVPEDLLDIWPGGDPETVKWLKRHGRLPRTWRDHDLNSRDENGYGAALELCRAQGGPGELELLERWNDCLTSGSSLRDLHLEEGRERLLDEQLPLDQFGDCERAALRVYLETSGPRLEWALESLEHGPIDLRRELERSLATHEGAYVGPFPNFPVTGFLGAVDYLRRAAVFAAIDGRPEECRRLLEATFHLVGLFDGRGFLVGFLISASAADRALDALEWSLPYLPPDVELPMIEGAISDWRPRAMLGDALGAERAAVNWTYEQLRGDGASGLAIDWTSVEGLLLGVGSRSVLYADQDNYLELMSTVIEECARPSYRGDGRVDQQVRKALDDRTCVMLASMTLPGVSNLHETALTWDVRIEQAKAALLAHKGGLEAARAHITTIADPFCASALRARIEGDERLLMWSVGADGDDDGAKRSVGWADYEDIVWHYRQHAARDRR